MGLSRSVEAWKFAFEPLRSLSHAHGHLWPPGLRFARDRAYRGQAGGEAVDDRAGVVNDVLELIEDAAGERGTEEHVEELEPEELDHLLPLKLAVRLPAFGDRKPQADWHE